MSKEKPCDDCDKDESSVFREGKVQLRFIRANKNPRGAMQNYKDGEVYWMFPRHARMPWWTPIDQIDYPIVPPATEKESAIIIGDLEDMAKPAYIGESGITVKPGVGLTGEFVEPNAPAQIIAPDVPKVQGQEEPKDFPEVVPSEEWTKKDLLTFIKEKGGFATLEMRKKWLVEIALNLSQT